MRYIVVLLSILLAIRSAMAIPDTVGGGAQDTFVSQTSPLMAMRSGSSTITTGANGILFGSFSTQTQCDQETLRAFVKAGSPLAQQGADLIGGVSSGTLTITSWGQSGSPNGGGAIGGFQAPQTIHAGQTLTGSGVNVAGVTISSQSTSTENGIIWNPITAASWAATSGGQVTFTTMSSHNVPVGHTFDVEFITPAAYTGTFTAITGTTGSTLKAVLVSNPGPATLLGLAALQTDACGSIGTVMGLGGCGTYVVSSMVLGVAPGTDFFALESVPMGVTYLNTAVATPHCNTGFNIVTFGMNFVGTPNTTYWFGLEMSSAPSGAVATSTNAEFKAIEY